MPPMQTVTFGQSFHRTDRVRVAGAVYDLLEAGGAMVLIVHDPTRSAPQPPPDAPSIPREEVDHLIRGYLGPQLRSGVRVSSSYGAERFEETLARTPFGRPHLTYAPGRPDLVRDVDGVIAGYLSMSFAAPYLFGSRWGDFIAELRMLLQQCSPTGRFCDWPGDTEVLIATR